MTKEQLVEELANIFEVYLKEEEIEYIYFYEDIAMLLKKADPERYKRVFNTTV